jgi:very-short-patch-repair endonuclease
MSTKLYNRKELKTTRVLLRNRLTSAEATLWNYLKDSQLCGKKFRRQHSIGDYIVDFYCSKEKLAIELDGEVHTSDQAYVNDTIRDKYLLEKGIRVIRFENELVFHDIDNVMRQIISLFRSH